MIDHADRRELRGSRILSAWLDHWDAREQNSMDVWLASDPSDKRSSPGYVVHYIIDTSDTLGGVVSVDDMSRRLGHSYDFDVAEIFRSLVTFGAEERPWDHARPVPGHEKFAFFRARDFDPPHIRRLVALGQWSDPGDAEYLTGLLVERQRRILARYLGVLSPLGDVRAPGPDQICATDFARLRRIAPSAAFHYTVVERGGGRTLELPVELGDGGALCFRPRPVVTGDLADSDPGRIVTFEVHNGAAPGPLVIHTYDLAGRGVRVVGLTRPGA